MSLNGGPIYTGRFAVFLNCPIAVGKGVKLVGAVGARAPTLFLPRPEFASIFSPFRGKNTPKFPALPRCAPTLFIPDWRPCTWILVFETFYGHSFLEIYPKSPRILNEYCLVDEGTRAKFCQTCVKCAFWKCVCTYVICI